MSTTEKLIIFGGLGAAVALIVANRHPTIGSGAPYLAQGYAPRNLKLAGPLDTPPTIYVYGTEQPGEREMGSGLL